VKTAGRDLAPDDRALVDCRFVDGWRYGDIAAHLAVPRGVLADRVRRLRTDLRRKAKALGAVESRAGVEAGGIV
jgi:DNA-directed RNA polymerase specialized sigma24 family protein